MLWVLSREHGFFTTEWLQTQPEALVQTHGLFCNSGRLDHALSVTKRLGLGEPCARSSVSSHSALRRCGELTMLGTTSSCGYIRAWHQGLRKCRRQMLRDELVLKFALTEELTHEAEPADLAQLQALWSGAAVQQ